MVHAHTVDDDDVALGIVCAQPQDLLIGCRPVATTRSRRVGDFGDDGRAGPASFEHLDRPAVYDESAPERPQRGVDAPKILDDRRAGAHLTHMRDSVSRHDVLLSTCDGSLLFRAAAPVDVGRQRTVGLRAQRHHNLLSLLLLQGQPRHPPTLGGQRVTGPGQLLLLHEQLLARSLPLPQRHYFRCFHRIDFRHNVPLYFIAFLLLASLAVTLVVAAAALRATAGGDDANCGDAVVKYDDARAEQFGELEREERDTTRSKGEYGFSSLKGATACERIPGSHRCAG